MVLIVTFYIFDLCRCGKDFMLALEKRNFIYKFNLKFKKPSLHFNLIDFSLKT